MCCAILAQYTLISLTSDCGKSFLSFTSSEYVQLGSYEMVAKFKSLPLVIHILLQHKIYQMNEAM